MKPIKILLPIILVAAVIMRRIKIKGIFSIAFCVFLAGYSLNEPERKTIDLAGEWSFKLDSENVGNQQEWFNQPFTYSRKINIGDSWEFGTKTQKPANQRRRKY